MSFDVNAFANIVLQIVVALTALLAMWRSLYSQIASVKTEVDAVKHEVNSKLDQYKQETAATAVVVKEAAVSVATLEAEKAAVARITELQVQLAGLSETSRKARTEIDEARAVAAQLLSEARAVASQFLSDARAVADEKVAEIRAEIRGMVPGNAPPIAVTIIQPPDQPVPVQDVPAE